MVPAQIFGVFHQAPKGNGETLGNAVGNIHRQVSLQAFNQRNHLGCQVRPLCQLFLREKTCLAMLPDDMPEEIRKISG